MAVYREGFKALELIQQQSKRIYNDACDYGALCNIGDKIWNAAKQLVEWYQDEEDKNRRQENRYETGRSCSAIVTLMDEWGYSDDESPRSAAKEKKYTHKYEVNFVGVKGGMKIDGQKYAGYVYINELK